jgi:ATP-dependent DNA helicase RecQ
MLYKVFLNQISDEAVLKTTQAKTKQMLQLCQSSKCRRQDLLRYFGETYASSNCNSCDRCLDDTESDETVVAQQILSCVYRLKQPFGIKHVIDVLRGAKTKMIFDRGHDRLSTYHLMPQYSEEDLRHYISILIDKGFLERSEGEYPVLRWTATSPNVARGKQQVMMRKRALRVIKPKKGDDLQCDRALFTKLSQLRQKYAQEMRVPAFVIFGDRSLIEMARAYPKNREAMLKINGVGPIKWERYGQSFLDVIAQHSKSP